MFVALMGVASILFAPLVPFLLVGGVVGWFVAHKVVDFLTAQRNRK